MPRMAKTVTPARLDSVDYPLDCMVPQDMENALVHELLHLHFAPLEDSSGNLFTEQAIESIAPGLITALRGK
jgi:hypothetical protein